MSTSSVQFLQDRSFNAPTRNSVFSSNLLKAAASTTRKKLSFRDPPNMEEVKVTKEAKGQSKSGSLPHQVEECHEEDDLEHLALDDIVNSVGHAFAHGQPTRHSVNSLADARSQPRPQTLDLDAKKTSSIKQTDSSTNSPVGQPKTSIKASLTTESISTMKSSLSTSLTIPEEPQKSPKTLKSPSTKFFPDVEIHTPPPEPSRYATVKSNVDGNPANSFADFNRRASGSGSTTTSPTRKTFSKESSTVPASTTTFSSIPLHTHETQLLKERLDQQSQAAQAALAQVNLLREQLAIETHARLEAQSRTHQLLLHNKELLDHLTNLVHHIRELEKIPPSESGSGRSPRMHATATPLTSSVNSQMLSPSTHYQEALGQHLQRQSLLESSLFYDAQMQQQLSRLSSPGPQGPFQYMSNIPLSTYYPVTPPSLRYNVTSSPSTNTSPLIYYPSSSHSPYSSNYAPHVQSNNVNITGAIPPSGIPDVPTPSTLTPVSTPTTPHKISLRPESPAPKFNPSPVPTSETTPKSTHFATQPSKAIPGPSSSAGGVTSKPNTIGTPVTSSSCSLSSTTGTASPKSVHYESPEDDYTAVEYLNAKGKEPSRSVQGIIKPIGAKAPDRETMVPKPSIMAKFLPGKKTMLMPGSPQMPQSPLGRSVSEKMGHKSSLMNQILLRSQWARHTTK